MVRSIEILNAYPSHHFCPYSSTPHVPHSHYDTASVWLSPRLSTMVKLTYHSTEAQVGALQPIYLQPSP
ncbi:hypothetical protein L873DRAFT_1808549 [Choiromyces venosus 120613-1]|uniref:Uncharacterized protein n=1 Tax=Choiromyces venosus 120613-1 TaxID=1336337 RepID=A0A3N4JJ59_9PEZI|nr:hypothetical protein L873DRAFT_1808549 [Choiromyces venosus 120613-1]